jgi:aconitate hydratase
MATSTTPAKSTIQPRSHAFASTLKTFKTASGKTGSYYALPALAKQFPSVARLPVSIRIVLARPIASKNAAH